MCLLKTVNQELAQGVMEIDWRVQARTACDYWSLGVVAFELVTLKRPFSSGEEDSIAEILANIQKYERDPEAEPPFDPSPNGPSKEWRSLVAGLLRVIPARRYTYLDMLQHAALAHTAVHSIREQGIRALWCHEKFTNLIESYLSARIQKVVINEAKSAGAPVTMGVPQGSAPPWVPRLRGAEDASYFSVEPRPPQSPSAAPFRSRPPFAGQLPFIGYSYVAPEENEDSTAGFNASHDCTAIDLATFKSAEKLAAMRGREVASLQSKLAAAEAAMGAEAERTRRDAEAEAERMRARLQAEITALSLQNRRLERQVEVEKEERMALQRTNQELSTGIAERNANEVHAARAHAASLQSERDVLKEDLRRLETRIAELQGECARATAAADSARSQHQHYRDSVAKERALRRQTLSGGEAENRELATRVATAEATAARETRAREHMEKRLADLEDEYGTLQAENTALHADLDTAKKELEKALESANEKQCLLDSITKQLKDVQQQVAQDRVRIPSLVVQVQELERGLEEAARREAALEEQCSRTEARLRERLEAADARVTAAVADEARHREKVNTLEQLVRRLEREVSALENRVCSVCAARAQSDTDTRHASTDTKHANTDTKHADTDTRRTDTDTSRSSTDMARAHTDKSRTHTDTIDHRDAHSDTESLADAAHAQLALLKEQLERAENQLQARAEEIATLRQECRTANLARWRKEREHNDLIVEAKSTARDLKRLEERLSLAQEARKTAEQKATALENEMTTLKPQYEQASKEVERLRERLEKLRKAHEIAQAEVDRSRNDIRKLKSELQYSEKRRMHAEEQEELSSRERAQLRDELHQARAQNEQLSEPSLSIRFKRNIAGNKPPLRPKPPYLRNIVTLLSPYGYRAREGAWMRRVRFALVADLLQGRCRATDSAITAINTHIITNNKALQEACSLLEEQLTDLEKLADIHELKNKDLEAETQRLRSELECCRGRLMDVERQSAERGAAAIRAEQLHNDAKDLASHQHCQMQLLRERLENRESRVAELEARLASLESDHSATEAALNSAMRRVRDLQEESSALRTRAHDHHAHALQLQASLADAQEEAAAAREAAEAAAAWWRTRETKADATLRQQAKLIDFLQAKVEEAGRKKCSLSNKLFGRSGRRSAASPPLRRANRELREEVERLRAQLSKRNGEVDCPPFPATPKRDKSQTEINKKKSIDMPDGTQDNNTLQVIWADGSRDRMRCRYEDGALLLNSGERTLRAKYLTEDAAQLPHNEAGRAFTVKFDSPAKCTKAAIVCPSISSRNEWVSRLRSAPAPAPSLSYAPLSLVTLNTPPTTGLYVTREAVAIGCSDGLYSLRGPIGVEYESDGGDVEGMASAAGRVLVLYSGSLVSGSLLTLSSTLRRAANLKPTLQLTTVRLPDNTTPHLVKAAVGCDGTEVICAAVACGRRVFLLRFDAVATEFRIARSLTVDRPPASVLLTPRALYIAGEKPLRVNLPSGMLEAFGNEEPLIAAAARKHSPPRAILLIHEEPFEILLCYAECGIFVDENGKRTRNEDPKWSSAVRSWEFVDPFLYIVDDEKISILYINDDAYRAPPCTCDTTSLASTASECYMPETFNLKMKEPVLLCTTPNGIIVSCEDDDGYKVSLVEGSTAFRSVGASIESLETISDTKSSSTDLAQSTTDLSPQNDSRVSQESVEATTGFLADIRKRARQLRNKNHKDQTPDEVIKKILTTEVGLKRSNLNGRKSPASVSEFDSDSTESEDKTEGSKCTNDICAEMFTRQVRFQ
ncbi:unnamed protein product [Diatraea saccharalis]|uniref:Citron Rho-interacting kinase n=1 Tax=Diatraea saccharalis TaxID=40085 RepID=A0A9N9R6Z3_9NEOP|nr:unnamed protein product [Diatraea saccharalis]